MPLIQVTASQGLLGQDDQDALMSRLSSAVLRSEGADADDPAARALVWAFYSEQPAGSCYVGGENPDQPPVRIAVTTPEGALNETSRRGLVGEIGEIVDDLVGVYEARLNHWAMLYEVDDGSWGGAGQVFNLAAIQSAMNIPSAQ